MKYKEQIEEAKEQIEYLKRWKERGYDGLDQKSMRSWHWKIERIIANTYRWQAYDPKTAKEYEYLAQYYGIDMANHVIKHEHAHEK